MTEQVGRLLLGSEAVEVVQKKPLPLPDGQGVEYRGGRGLFGLLLKNTLLGIVTIGLYRFWARTALRRYFWSAISVNGEPLEYTGRGSELFIGFLVVMAVFVPVSLIYYTVQTMLVGNAAALGWLDIFYFAAILLLVAAGQYRARRYRLSRTVWRGIRAAQDGSTWAYVGRYAVWSIAFFLTLGLSVPWAAADLARYRIDHTSWGDQCGHFHGRASGLLWPWLRLYLLAVMPLLIMAAVLLPTALSSGMADFGKLLTTATIGFSKAERIALLVVAILPWVLLPAAFTHFTFCWLRWYLDGTSVGFLKLHAGFRPWRLALRVVLSYLLILVMLSLVMALIVLLFGTQNFSMSSFNPVLALTALAGFLIFYVFGGIFTTLLIVVPVLRRIVDGITVDGLERIDAVMQSDRPWDKSGEGLADSFDIGIG